MTLYHVTRQDVYWKKFCKAILCEDLGDDPRFISVVVK